MSKSEQAPKAPAISRRNMLKTVTIGGGIVVSKWSTPVVEGIVLPGHATTTQEASPQGFDRTRIGPFSIVFD